MAEDQLQTGWSWSMRSVNGVSLHVIEAGEAGSLLAILLHGFPEFWWAWRHQITPLAQAGFHVVAPDLRGYNKSDKPEGVAAYHIDILTADVVAVADAVGAELHLVGYPGWGDPRRAHCNGRHLRHELERMPMRPIGLRAP